MSHKASGLISLFVRHRVAANLLMMLMILAGAWALGKLNTQFFPDFELELITVRVIWSGASAEDIETGVTAPLEQELRTLDNLYRITSTSATGVAAITLEYNEGTAMDAALEQVNSVLGQVRNLPNNAESPEVRRITRYEPIARVLLTGEVQLDELRPLAQRLRDQLLERGISRVDIGGLPKQELAIQISTRRLLELGMSLDQIGHLIQQQSRDLPAGTVGQQDVARQLRLLGQQRDKYGFETLPIRSESTEKQLLLGQIADIQLRPRPNQVRLSIDGRNAVELRLYRAVSADSLSFARVLHSWLDETRPTLPSGIQLRVFDQQWALIKERIMLLLTNGGGGLLLIIGILLIFLNRRVAFWVTVGIPVSFMTALAALYLAGGSINMISLFGLIMALGIIVDDAIVVGEDALAHFETGEPPVQAVEGGAYRMLAPVMSASLTTIAAFLPLMLVGGIIGNMMYAIPLVVICVIIASLIECFLILPGHLRGAFQRMAQHRQNRPGRFRQWFDTHFDHFRKTRFRHWVTLCIQYRGITLSTAVGILILTLGLVVGGRLGFTFFPNVEGRLIFATVSFAAGSPPERVEAFLTQLEKTLQETESALGGNLVETALSRRGIGESAGGGNARPGDQHGSIMVEMVSSERRTITNKDFIAAWEQRVEVPAGIESFTIAERRAGHPGRDIDIRLTGNNPLQLKYAAIELINTLNALPGVSAVEDDLPWGQEQLIVELTPTGQALGLDIETVGTQLRSAFDGQQVQVYLDGQDEIEVRLMLPDLERLYLAGLDTLQLILPDGRNVPLASVANMRHRRGFDALRHTEGKLAVSVSGDVDRNINNNNVIRTSLQQSLLPELLSKYGVHATFQGRAQDQNDTLKDLRHGALLAFILMYIILAWVFSSYSRPLVVMAIIPFGLVGAIIGHWLMGLELTVLSLFGFFGLSGIVVNDAIILISFYQKLKAQGISAEDAMVEAACRRLRAVLLTSLTTIAGLTPLLFETSLQAQFLIPMAATICFGLAFSTLLVLLVIPVLTITLEDIKQRMFINWRPG
jgi:multidrug efflux pump subunit AcrB